MRSRHLRSFFIGGILSIGLCALAADTESGSASAPVADHKPLRYENPLYLTGSIYDEPDRSLLFKFSRKATRLGARLNVVRDFTYPDGRLAARERVVYESDWLMFYELEDNQTGAKGSVVIHRESTNPSKGTIEFDYVKPGAGNVSSRKENLAPDILLNDMVAPFLLSHLPALVRGEKVKCRIIVVHRKETVGFTFTKDADSRKRERAVVIVRMEPTSPILRGLIEPLFFTIEREAPYRVLEYTGRTIPKLQVGNAWRDLDALTVFDWK